jgi:DNA-binding NarL/FixJ family response regulator
MARGHAAVNILLVEDHPMMADALSLSLARLERTPQIQRVGDLESAFKVLEAGAEPDLVMLDLGLPGCSGIEALERLRSRFPALPVVVVSGERNPGTINAALDLGAMGFIPKSAPSDVFLNAVRLVASGGIYVPVEALNATSAQSAGTSSAPDLSPRQKQVLALLLKGLPNKLIARKLDISENTTKVHVSAVLHALGVGTRTQALIAANRLGLRLDA